MKTTFVRLLAIAVLAAPTLGAAAPATWNVDPAHTQTTFTVRHLGLTDVTGEFKSTAGTVVLDDADPAKAQVEATVDARTIHTREDRRDAHLRSPDFFDVEKFPTITFRSTKVEKVADGRYKVSGDLTLHGVTKPVVFDATLTGPVKGMMGEARRGATATTTINRKDFGLNWSKMVEAVPVVSDDVRIAIEAELVQAGTGKGPKS